MMQDKATDFASLLLRSWRTLAVFIVLGVVGGLVYGLVAPKWYQATLTVVPSQTSKDSPAMSLMANLPSISGLDSSIHTDVQRINAVLTSNSVADQVIDKFQLMRRYDVAYRERAREALAGHCHTSADRRSGVVTLSCEDKEPKVAMEMAAYFGEVGNQVFKRVSASSAREERKFLESQVVKARSDVDDASRQLREFQVKHKVIDLPEQSKAVISAMASIQGELLSKQLELSYLTSFSARTEAGVLQLQQQIDIMQKKLAQLESSQTTSATPRKGSNAVGSGSGANDEFFPDAMTVPALRFELEQLLRDQKIKETVFFLMTQRFEMAKVNEARDTSTFQILDQPTLPTYKIRPNRIKALVLAVLLGLAAGAAFILLPVFWRKKIHGTT
jgi:tyrosine-protein kinase Etk/Wzc